MNDTNLILNSAFEGHTLDNCLKAYESYLEVLKRQGLFFELDDKGADILKVLQNTLSEGRELLKLYPNFARKDRISNKRIKQQSKALLDKINEGLFQGHIEKKALSLSKDQPGAEAARLGFKSQVLDYLKGASENVWHARGQQVRQMVETYCKQFAFDEPFEAQAELMADLQAIVLSFAQDVPESQSQLMSAGWLQVQQKVIEKRQERAVRADKPVSLMAHKRVVHSTLLDPDYGIKDKQSYLISTQEHFKCKDLAAEVYFEVNFLRTASVENTSCDVQLLKPIHQLLILMHKDRVWAEIVASDLLETYFKELTAYSYQEGVEHQAFIIQADGRILQLGTGVLRPQEDRVAQILQSPWLKDVIENVALFNGNLRLHTFKQKPELKVVVEKAVSQLLFKSAETKAQALAYLNSKF